MKMVDNSSNKNIAENNNEKEDDISLTDSDSSYVIEEEIVEYEISDTDEEKTMNTKKVSSSLHNMGESENERGSIKNLEKERDAIVNIDDTNKELPKGTKDSVQKEIGKKTVNDVNESFKNVSDSMENIKIRLSTSHLDVDSYNKVGFDKTEKEFMRDIKRMRYVVSRINDTHNSLKKALHDMKGNPFDIPDDEAYIDLASECNTESVAEVNVDFCEDDLINVDEADIFEKYILCIDEENREKFADHYENLYNVNEMFKKTIFSTIIQSTQSSLANDIEENEVAPEVAVA